MFNQETFEELHNFVAWNLNEDDNLEIRFKSGDDEETLFLSRDENNSIISITESEGFQEKFRLSTDLIWTIMNRYPNLQILAMEK